MAFSSLPSPWPVSPFALMSDLGINTNNAGAAGANNTVIFVAAEPLQATITIIKMRARFSIGGNGHYDLGVYDSTGANLGPGNLLCNCASSATALATSASTVSPVVLANTILNPGLYWLALWIDNTTDTFNRQTISGNMAPVMSGTVAAGPLPATASAVTGLANSGILPFILGLRLGGWS